MCPLQIKGPLIQALEINSTIKQYPKGKSPSLSVNLLFKAVHFQTWQYLWQSNIDNCLLGQKNKTHFYSCLK